MTIQYFGINRGEQLNNVATGTATTAKKIELAVDDSVGLTRNEIRDQVEVLLQQIYNQRATPFK
jgi:hypothetical protein